MIEVRSAGYQTKKRRPEAAFFFAVARAGIGACTQFLKGFGSMTGSGSGAGTGQPSGPTAMPA